jgi:DNA-binding NarL/FixJ family response regulator
MFFSTTQPYLIMHDLSKTQEDQSPENTLLRPVIITANQHFYDAIMLSIPELQQYCIHASLLEHIKPLWSLLGNNLLVFIDLDSYEAASLINFMCSVQQVAEDTIIGLSECDDPDQAISYLRSGFGGYFLKSEMNAGLIAHTISTLLNNGLPLSPSITQKIIVGLIDVQKNPYESLLSKREQEILNRLVEGSSYKMIAHELSISIETVRHHIKHLYKKLNVNSKGEAIAKMLRYTGAPPFM